MLLGGVIAAPIAARLVRRIPARILGSAVGGLIVLLNTRTLLSEHALNTAPEARVPIYLLVLLAWAAAITHVIRLHRNPKNWSAADSHRIDHRYGRRTVLRL